MILDEIISHKQREVQQLKKQVSIKDYEKQIETAEYTSFSLKEALTCNRKRVHIIAEIKKASPSKGIINEAFPYLEIAKAYEEGGADALSVLTEEKYFKGSNTYLSEIKKVVNKPIIRKDFIIDEIQIYEAKAIGADAILLIVAVLPLNVIKAYIKLAHSLGLDALVETHNEEEVKVALESGAQIIGINNRNLNNFEVNLQTTETLIGLIPQDKLVVSESGIHTVEDIKRLRKANCNAFLIGESMMRANNPIEVLESFKKY